MKTLILIACIIVASISQSDAPASSEQVVMAVGQIFPGEINVQQNKQAIHYLKVQKLQRKYLFIRVNTQDKIRMAIGLYSNQTRQIVYACQDNIFDSCYIPSKSLKQNSVYVILIVADQSLKYNLYTYWGDLQHLKPNQQIKFMFDNSNPTQLFHLEFENQKQFQQIRLILKPQTMRVQGDNLRIYANLGFSQQPTVQKHQFESVYIWGDAQAIILNKQQLKNEKGIGIYIVGNAETVYKFQPQFLKHTSHTLKLDQLINDYLPQHKSAVYKMNFKDNNNVDNFVIKISAFSGEISAQFFYDEQLQRPYSKTPYQYMSDLQFNFERKDFQKTTQQIFMQIKSQDSVTTFQVSLQARSNDTAYQITQNIYQFIVLNNPRQAMYFNSHVWDSNLYEQSKNYRFDISMIKIFGNCNISYYRCLPQASQAQCRNINDPKFMTHVNQIKPFGVEEVGSKIITTLQLKKDQYKTVNNVQKQVMIIIVLDKTGTEQAGLAIQYTNPNQVRLLREGRAFEDKVRMKQKNYYKYINNNPKISQIRIHINEITGLTKIKANQQNIHQEGGNMLTIDPNQPDTIIIKQNVTKPIYIEVQGVVTSLFTISVTAVHTDHLISNSLVMSQDVQYEVKLLPYQHINIQLHPIEARVVFQYYTEGGSVMICRVDEKDMCVEEKSTGSSGQLKIDTSSSRYIRIRIGNYQQTKALANQNPTNKAPSSLDEHLTQNINKVKLTLIYHAQGLSHCDERRLNKVYSQNVKSGTCFKFHLPILADFQIMAARSDLGETTHIYFLCSKKITPIQINDRFVVKSDVIQTNCKQSQNQMILQMVVSDTGIQPKSQIKMDYSVQYFSDTVTLAEGVAYTAKGLSIKDSALRTYFYQILDQDRDVNIILYNKKGIQKFFARVTSKPDRYSGFVTEAQSKFNSKNSNYYTNPYIKITPKEISDAKCGRTCVLVLSIYSTQSSGTQIQYALQVTQNHVYLKQDQIKTDFLPKGSVKFYQYEGKASKGNLIFKVSDNNRKCARSIMSKNPFPTASNYFVKQNEGTIVYQKSQKGTYYFAVQAIEDCPYSVSVSQGEAKIIKMDHGQFYDVKLSEGQQKWFYVRHSSNNSFKIISLKQKGEITIYANQTDLTKQSIQKVQGKKSELENFAFKSSYMNTLNVNSNDKNYCFNCYYIICVKAVKATEASIMLGSQDSKIVLSQNKILFDEIFNKNAVTYAIFYKVSDGKLQVKVHAGKINFQMSYASQKFSKVFNQNKKVYHQTYNFTKQDGLYEPIAIKITAQTVPALYSFELEPTSQQTAFVQKVNPGEHTFIYLQKGKTECFTGYVSQKDEQIFLSVDTTQKFSLSSLNLSVKIDEFITTNYQKQVVGNLLSLQFKSQQTFIPKPRKYNICVNTQAANDSLSLIVFQNHKINLIHSDTEVLVRNQAKFVLYPRNDIILDLFQCQGTAQIYYGNNLQKIREKQSHRVDLIGIPGQAHAIRISQFSTVYLDITAKMATVLWMPLVQKQERGVGYFRYGIGNLQYNSRFNSIQFKVGGVYKMKQTNTKVVSIRYTIYVSNSKQRLQEAVMCQKTLDNLVSASILNSKAGQSSAPIISLALDKKKITDAFSQNQTLYYNAVADMVLQPPQKLQDKEHEHYRFVYFQQVVPAELFRQNKVQSMQLTLLIVLAAVSIIGFILISCIFIRCIVPAIGKLRNRVLVQQNQDPKDQSIPVPPSSDRNQIPTNLATGTQQQMNKV